MPLGDTPDEATAFVAFCGDQSNFIECERSVLFVNGPKFVRKTDGYPDCAIMVHGKTETDHAVQRLLDWMSAHPSAQGTERDAAITEALNRSLALC